MFQVGASSGAQTAELCDSGSASGGGAQYDPWFRSATCSGPIRFTRHCSRAISAISARNSSCRVSPAVSMPSHTLNGDQARPKLARRHHASIAASLRGGTSDAGGDGDASDGEAATGALRGAARSGTLGFEPNPYTLNSQGATTQAVRSDIRRAPQPVRALSAVARAPTVPRFAIVVCVVGSRPGSPGLARPPPPGHTHPSRTHTTHTQTHAPSTQPGLSWRPRTS